MKIYDILVGWYTGYERARLRQHTQWHRGIKASSLTEASKKALAFHQDKILPAVLAGWPIHPQP